MTTYCACCDCPEEGMCPDPRCDGKKFERLTEDDKRCLKAVSALIVEHGGERLLKVTGAILRQVGGGAYNVGLHLDILSRQEW